MTFLSSRDTPSMSGGNDKAPYNVDGDLIQETPTDFYMDTQKATIIKWSVIGGLFILLASWVIIGHLHARRRLRKGLPLLFYHRYLVASQKPPPPITANYNDIERADNAGYYAPPPPAYVPREAPPPSYQPPSNDVLLGSPELQEKSSSQSKKQKTVLKNSFFPKSWKLGFDGT